MTCNEASLTDNDLLNPSRGKDSAVWIAPSRALRDSPCTIEADALFRIGVLRLLVGVGPEQRLLTIYLVVSEFDADWALEGPGKPWDKCVPVIVYILLDLH